MSALIVKHVLSVVMRIIYRKMTRVIQHVLKTFTGIRAVHGVVKPV